MGVEPSSSLTLYGIHDIYDIQVILDLLGNLL